MPKVSSYTAVTVAVDSDTFYVIQGGVSSKVTALTMRTYFQANLGTAAFSATTDFDAAGTAAAGDAAHVAASDPHPQYLTAAEGNAAYDAINAASSAITAHVALSDPHTQYLLESDAATTYATPSGVSALIFVHTLQSDPHSLSYYTKTYIDANFQPLDATLTALAGVTTASDKLIYATGVDTFATTTFTSFGRSLVDDADAAAARTTLGLGALATLSVLTLATLPTDFHLDPGGRLTAESGVAASTTDQTSKSTLYYTPDFHGLISVPNGSGGWSTVNTGELSLALSGLTSGKNYDVFAYLNSGSLTFDLGTAWTSDTARSLALTTLNGRRVNNSSFTSVIRGHTVGASAGLYLGTIRTTATTTTEDSATKRFIWNLYNQRSRWLLRNTAASGYTYSTATWRYINNDSAHKLELVCGVAAYSMLDIIAQQYVDSTLAVVRYCGIGIDTGTTANVSDGKTKAELETLVARLLTSPAIGYHFYAWVEFGAGSGTQTWYPSGVAFTGQWQC